MLARGLGVCALTWSCGVQGGVTLFTHGKVLRDHTLREEELWVKDGVIVEEQAQADQIVDLRGAVVAPGFLDLQINGGFGVDFTTEPERVREVAKRLPQMGVTSFLPTLITASPEQYEKIANVEIEGEGAQVLGFHIEGPYLAKEKKGAHPEGWIVTHFEEVAELYPRLERVKLVTLAPELPQGKELTTSLCAEGIVVSLGHTQCSLEQAREAKGWGGSFVTHLFNAMPPLHHRKPSLIGAVLGEKILSYSMIVDGIHVDPAVVRLAWNAHPKGMVLVTDAMAAMGWEEGSFVLGDKDVEVSQGRATLAGTETLAGSVLQMDCAVRNLKAFTGCSAVEALEAASLRPAELLGLSQKGHLNPGADADFVVLDSLLHVRETYIKGKRIYNANDETEMNSGD